MRLARTLPPAAAPMGAMDVLSGLLGIVQSRTVCERFSSELASNFGVKHCFLVSSGKTALTLSLLALRKLNPDRDEVVIPAFTCYSIPAAILRAGLKVRLCDLDADSLDFDFEQLSILLGVQSAVESDNSRKAVNALEEAGSKNSASELGCKILAVLPTHLFGFPSDVMRLRGLIRDSGIFILEDAAQAMGELSEQQKLGTLGDIGIFSLARGKVFSTVEGGIIITNRDDIAEVLARLVQELPKYRAHQQLALIAKAISMVFLISPWLYWIPKSIPQLKLGETLFDPHFHMRQMSSFQAGLAKNWKCRLESVRSLRIKNAKMWDTALDALGSSGCRFWKADLRGLIRFPVRIFDTKVRDSLLESGEKYGTGMMRVYPTSIDRIPALADIKLGGPFNNAAKIASELVTLPTHAFLKKSDVERVVEMLAQALSTTTSNKQR